MFSSLPLDLSLLRPGMRLGVGVSGGADSVALLRALAERAAQLGLVLHVAHLHHGLRGAESDADQEFVRALAAKLRIEFHTARIDTTAEAAKAGEGIEEAARRLRYSWFQQVLSEVPLHAMATAHTRDDQAETVLAKLLRGAWTEGLSGIHPTVEGTHGQVIRPLLAVSRVEIEAYLHAIGQPWREDGTNRDTAFTRNRIRHELLPQLEQWNPQIRERLVQMSELAREEEAWWQAEVLRLAQQLILPGVPVRGGGRAATDGLAIEITRLAALPIALQRRLLRQAARQLNASADFAGTESLRRLALDGHAGQKVELEGLRAERTHRELRMAAGSANITKVIAEYPVEAPGEVVAAAFGVRLRISSEGPRQTGLLRPWKPGDRVRVRYTAGPKKIKEVLERMRVTGSDRAAWPVLELGGRVVWMRGVELEPEPGLSVTVEPLSPSQS
ncbi:MAG: tRNA lysidine(34) synthetase TilS [Terracidiphilus sp.]|nr:tRNA lysidine(34) synthetase TilS [Terracidiphilus sp.]